MATEERKKNSRAYCRARGHLILCWTKSPVMNITVVQLILLLSVTSALNAGDQGVSVRWTLAGFDRGYNAGQASYLLDLKTAPETPEGREKVRDSWDKFQARATKLFTSALEIAESNPKSEDGFAAVEWVLKHDDAHDLSVGLQGLQLVRDQHSGNPHIGSLIANLAYSLRDERKPTHQAALDLLKVVAETNPDRIARGQALLGLADIAKEKFEKADFTRQPEVDQLLAETHKAYELILRDYGDCPYLRTCGISPPRKTLGEEATARLFEMERLREGQISPEIEGEDLDGVKFRLSDYRGKVVLLVFWASWCGPCMAEVPHEKELVERFSGRPFVLIGVNGDSVKTNAVEAIQKHGIPWRSFWDEGRVSGRPISVAWNIRGWPTVYVLDHEGVIRHKYLRGEKLDDPLEKLISAAEAIKQGSR